MNADLLIVKPPSRWRHSLERFFCRCGFRVTVADDAEQCRAELKSAAPDVLFVDLDTAPACASLVRHLVRHGRTRRRMPAVVVVGTPTPEELSRRTGVAQSFCFAKPVAMESLLDQVGLAMALIDLHQGRRAAPSGTLRRARPQCRLA